MIITDLESYKGTSKFKDRLQKKDDCVYLRKW
jgi:hypothetical protein